MKFFRCHDCASVDDPSVGLVNLSTPCYLCTGNCTDSAAMRCIECSCYDDDPVGWEEITKEEYLEGINDCDGTNAAWIAGQEWLRWKGEMKK